MTEPGRSAQQRWWSGSALAHRRRRAIAVAIVVGLGVLLIARGVITLAG
jgi:hypothetical protein